MGFNLIVAFAVLCAMGVFAGDKKECIHQKYTNSLGNPYTECYTKAKDLPIPRMKKCWENVMKTKGVVVVASDGQRTVNREKFGQYGRENSHDVGRGMSACYNDTRADDDMYLESARASQCVFDKVKKKC